jgi:hypothetical protein
VSNDLHVTPDYGVTWLLVSGAAHYSPRITAGAISSGRQILLVGGANATNFASLNDVWTGFL